MIERQERSSSPMKLSKAQRTAKTAIETAARDRDGNATIFVLTGLPGTGKSETIKSVRSQIPDLSATDYSPTIISTIGRKPQRLHVVTATPLETHLLHTASQQELSSKEITIHRMPGMTRDEITELIKDLRQERPYNASLEEQVRQSMGIPRLGTIMTTQRFSEPARVAANYLSQVDMMGINASTYEDIREQLQPYISSSLLPSSDIFEQSLLLREERRKESYPVPLQTAKSHQPPEELPPDFEDRATIDIYRRALSLSQAQRNQADTRVLFYLSALSREEYTKIARSFNLSSDNKFMQQGRIADAIVSSPRGKMFGIEGKIAAFAKSSQGVIAYDKDRLDPGDKSIIDFNQFTENDSQGTRLALGYHEHAGLYFAPLKFGQAVDSLLQHAAIEYTAYNGIAGIVYRYNPQERKIQILK